ncbi:NUDIX hydrolase domain-like protein [Phycomyces nitens]|nr:NUDIX hydrolase domain-like protein [Phycomyces nitens]
MSLPPEQRIEYTKKARHGHNQDMTDENNIRQVAGCLPIDHQEKRFLLISSRKNADAWVLPKGGWEVNETKEQAALRETWEEAGVKGIIYKHIGVFADKTNKGKVKAHHWVYELEIQEVVKKFPERKKRERRWFTYEEALLAVQSPFIREAIRMSSLNPANYPESSPRVSDDSQPTLLGSPPPTIKMEPVHKPMSFGAKLKALFIK